MIKNSPIKSILLVVLVLLLCTAFLPTQERTVFLVGDSTVRNGRGTGDGGLWGWGNFITAYLDTNKINVQNSALGGTSSRSFRSGGYWEKVEKQIQPGDIVLIQFGHNDGNPTTLKGISDDSLEVFSPYTKTMVMAHTFGWNIRMYIRDTRAKGGIPIVVSLVPRNIWKDGKLNRVAADFVRWAGEVAEQENAGFIDLNRIVADHYDEMGEEKVRSTFFTDKDHVHTNEEGARFNAACVIEGLRKLSPNPLEQYLLPETRQ